MPRKFSRGVFGLVLIAFTTTLTAWSYGTQSGLNSVLVILNDQDNGPSARQELKKELLQSGVADENVQEFKSVNLIHAKLTKNEIETLRKNPAVAKVIVDRILVRKKINRAGSPKKPPAAAEGFVTRLANRIAPLLSSSPLAPNPGTLDASDAKVIAGSCAEPGKVMLEPEALEVLHVNSENPSLPTARALGFTGKGVRVAAVADQIDPKNINFIRADGTSAVIENLDFVGLGTNPQNLGNESFMESYLDLNSIGGQGLHSYDISHISAEPLPSPCNIRIEGVAPNAEMGNFIAFALTVDTWLVNPLMAVDYVISSGKYDVINESFIKNFIPDVESEDVLELLNREAIKRGMVVTISAGDAGPNNTLGSPGITAPETLNLGASTTFRTYTQTNAGMARYFATGWVSDNVSMLSSGGYGETGRTLDLVAPGDQSFVSCDNGPAVAWCTDLQNKPSDTQVNGGTSEAAPLTAGVAALVIEAYREAHNGAKPKPGLIKEIITSSATDLSTDATEQGAGLENAYKAVLLASSVENGHPTSSAVIKALSQPGVPLLLSHEQLNYRGLPGERKSWELKITNPARIRQHVHVYGQTLSNPQVFSSGTTTLSDGTSAKLIGPDSSEMNYEKIGFTVPVGTDHLAVNFAFEGTTSPLGLTLIDPSGRIAGDSLPFFATSGAGGNHGRVEIRAPLTGDWTGIFYSALQSKSGVGAPISWQATTQHLQPFGSVSSQVISLAPGEIGEVTVSAELPETTGDSWGSFVVESTEGGNDPVIGKQKSSLPVTLRTLIDLKDGGTFNGVITGGNGRGGFPNSMAQTNFYQFSVDRDSHHRSVTADLQMSVDPKNQLEIYLVNPSGNTVAFGKNQIGGEPSLNLSATALDVMPGLWTLVVNIADPVVGDILSQTFTGKVSLDLGVLHSTNVPNNAEVHLAGNKPVTYNVTLTNPTQAAQAYFLDARLEQAADLPLFDSPPTGMAPATSASCSFPFSKTDIPPYFAVPSQTESVTFSAEATAPVLLNYGTNSGDPNLSAESTEIGPNQLYQVTGTYEPKSGEVTPGEWYLQAAPTSGSADAMPAGGKVTFSAIVHTLAFDRTMIASTGDYWLQTIDSTAAKVNPVIVQPGAQATLQVTVTPTGNSGDVVKGTLFIGTYTPTGNPDGMDSANEVGEIPYEYSIQREDP